VLLIAMLNSCVGTKQFKEGKYVLYNQKTIAPKAVNKEDLNKQLTQKKNRRLLGLPIFYYAAIYNTGLKNFDSAKYDAKKASINIKYDDKILNYQDKPHKIPSLNKKRNKKILKQDKSLEEGNLFMRWGEPLIYLDSAETEKSIINLTNFLRSNGIVHT